MINASISFHFMIYLFVVEYEFSQSLYLIFFDDILHKSPVSPTRFAAVCYCFEFTVSFLNGSLLIVGFLYFDSNRRPYLLPCLAADSVDWWIRASWIAFQKGWQTHELIIMV